MKAGQMSLVGCSLELYIRTGEQHRSWVRGNRKLAEGKAEPGNKVDAAPGHSFNQYLLNTYYVPDTPLDTGDTGVEELLISMMAVFLWVSQTDKV